MYLVYTYLNVPQNQYYNIERTEIKYLRTRNGDPQLELSTHSNIRQM